MFRKMSFFFSFDIFYENHAYIKFIFAERKKKYKESKR